VDRPHVVIVGGGFGGLAAARALRKAPVRITLVDARNHHVFQPLLYQVATAGLNPSDIAAPIRSVLRRQKNARVLLGRVDAIDVASRSVRLHDEGSLGFDYLIVATGVTHSYFGHDDWEPDAPGLKTVEDALEIRRRLLFAFEAAEHEEDEVARAAWMTFAVVGGGPTGVELAGALAELSNHTLARDFRRIDPRRAKIVLFEGGDRILAAFDEGLGAKADAQLQRLGVTVRTGARVAGIDPSGVTLTGGEVVPCHTTLWAAGVAGSPLARSLGAPLERSGRVLVDPTLAVSGSGRVFVIGDLAALKQANGKWVPGVAPAAIQGGEHVARTIQRALKGEPAEPFVYTDKGSMATVGRRAAIADLGWLKLSGFSAWVAWLMIHIMFLVGFRNRLIVLFQWTWAYWTFQRGARLITGPISVLKDRVEDPKEPPPPGES
jgi:NADH dehydrogenase